MIPTIKFKPLDLITDPEGNWSIVCDIEGRDELWYRCMYTEATSFGQPPSTMWSQPAEITDTYFERVS